MKKTIAERIHTVEIAKTEKFTDLVKLAGLDPATAFRFHDLRNVDFSDCDLTGYDFTGCKLDVATFKNTKIKGAIFDERQLDYLKAQGYKFSQEINERIKNENSLSNIEIAYKRIESCRNNKDTSLDLGGLTLDLRLDHPIWPKIFELSWLQHLYLSLGEEARKKALWDLLKEDIESCNVLEVLPDKLSFALSNLRELYLSNTFVSDVASLQAFTDLTVLNLCNTLVRDASPLGVLTNLIELNLSNTVVVDLKPFEHLTNLTVLKLWRTSVSDVMPLQNLTNLTELNLSNTFVSDVTPLQGLTNLTSLNLESTKVSDVTPLQGLTNLTSLNLGSTKVSDLTVLREKLPQLKISGLAK